MVHRGRIHLRLQRRGKANQVRDHWRMPRRWRTSSSPRPAMFDVDQARDPTEMRADEGPARSSGQHRGQPRQPRFQIARCATTKGGKRSSRQVDEGSGSRTAKRGDPSAPQGRMVNLRMRTDIRGDSCSERPPSTPQPPGRWPDSRLWTNIGKSTEKQVYVAGPKPSRQKVRGAASRQRSAPMAWTKCGRARRSYLGVQGHEGPPTKARSKKIPVL